MAEKNKKQDKIIVGENNIVNTSGGSFVSGDVRLGTTNIFSASYPPDKKYSYIPPLPSLFVGREQELAFLKSQLGITSQGSQHLVTVVRGLPGSGKTALVSVLVHDPDVMDYFADGILWVSLGTDPTIRLELDSWLRTLGINSANFSTAEEASAQITSALASKRTLLVIDGVWDLKYAIPFMVGGRDCHTIITTRITSVAQKLASTPKDILALSVMTEAESVQLLTLLAPTVAHSHPDKILELARVLEGLPLALQVAGRLLNVESSYGFGIDDLLAQIEKGGRILESSAPPSSFIEFEKEISPTVSKLIKESVDRLDNATKNYFALLGVFAPQPATFDINALQVVWEVNDPKPIVRTLVERGLLEYVPTSQRYQLHSLLVMYARSLLVDE